uniref:ABC transmembrane type-1 domain-containing protein n=1 Tax=Syphacia muris TaxID=451379 RepID=A0A0N5A9C9_9BILA
MDLKKYTRKILPSLINTLLVVFIIFFGGIQFPVIHSTFSTVEDVLKDVAVSYVDKLFISQSNDNEVEKLFEQMDSEVVYRLQARIGSKIQQDSTASYIMAFAIVSTLGDDRVDNSNRIIYFVFSTVGGILYMLSIALQVTYLNRFIGSLFVSGAIDVNSICQISSSKTEASQEYLLAHLEKQRQRQKKVGSTSDAYSSTYYHRKGLFHMLR